MPNPDRSLAKPLTFLGIGIAVIAIALLVAGLAYQTAWLPLVGVLAILGILLGAKDMQRRFDLSLEREQVQVKQIDRLSRLLVAETEKGLRLELLIESMSSAVVVLDKLGRVKLVNRRAAEWFLIDTESAIDRTLIEVIRNSELDAVATAVQNTNQPVVRDFELFGADSTKRLFEVSGLPLIPDKTGEHGVMLVFQDVTRLRHLEAIRSEFVDNVSHELKTPLTAIKGFLEALIEDGLQDRDQASRFIDIAARQADRMQAIIQDLLTLSRLEQTGGLISRAAESLATIVVDSLEVCLPQAQKKHSTLVVQNAAVTQAADPLAAARKAIGTLKVVANRSLLEQALVNLVDNAVKYSPEGSQVTIDYHVEGRDLIIEVSDNGPGIPARDLERLFERFYRVDRGRSRADGGTGLGLAIVKHIAAIHEGTAGVESTYGQGATFRLRLPVVTVEPESNQTAVDEPVLKRT